jgi:hypothetical protein
MRGSHTTVAKGSTKPQPSSTGSFQSRRLQEVMLQLARKNVAQSES